MGPSGMVGDFARAKRGFCTGRKRIGPMWMRSQRGLPPTTMTQRIAATGYAASWDAASLAADAGHKSISGAPAVGALQRVGGREVRGVGAPRDEGVAAGG